MSPEDETAGYWTLIHLPVPVKFPTLPLCFLLLLARLQFTPRHVLVPLFSPLSDSQRGGGVEYFHLALRVVEGKEKGTQCLGV
jgi:hypothetical protein